MEEEVKNLEQDATLELFRPYEHFCKCLLDAYAVVDASGKVLKCNALFSQLVGLKTRQILKSDSFDELLEMSIAEKKLTIRDILSSSAPTRIDEVSGQSSVSKSLNLIIGVYPLTNESSGSLGAFVLIRDVTAETNLQDKYKHKATQSITDPLTGLFNRTYFGEYLTSQMSSIESYPSTASQRQMTVAMLDIDFFKKINDNYGHQAGDFILKITAELMRKCFRKTDVICRYGGEEFLAILPSTDLEGGFTAAEKLRQTIASHRYDFEGTIIPVSISSGIAQIQVGVETAEQAIARADAALYFSKQSGRNRVSLHNGQEPIASQIFSAVTQSNA